jgi:hypothetical protein
MPGEWTDNGQWPPAQLTRADLNQLFDRVAEGHTSFSFRAHHDETYSIPGSSLDELKVLEDLERVCKLEVKILWTALDRLSITIDGRGCSYTCVTSDDTGLAAQRARRAEREWRNLPGRARVPRLAVWPLRVAVPLVTLVAWLISSWTGALHAFGGALSLLLIFATLSAVVLEAVSFGPWSAFQAVRAGRKVFVAKLGPSAWRDPWAAVVTLVIPLAAVGVAIWGAAGN